MMRIVSALRRSKTSTSTPTPPSATTSTSRGAQPSPGTSATPATPKDAWKQGNGEAAVKLVLMHKRTAADYLKRFPQCRAGWATLVAHGHVSAYRFAQTFEPERADIDRWMDMGVLSSSECVQLLATRQDLLREISMARNLDLGILCTRAPRYRKFQMASELLQANLPVPRALMAKEPRLHTMMWDMFSRNAVGFDTAFACAPRPPAEQIAKLVDAGVLNERQLHALGALDPDILRAKVESGEWKPRDVIARGPIPDALATLWIASRQITYTGYMQASLAAWHPEDSLPMAHVRLACAQSNPEELVASLTLPKDKARRMAYAQRMVVAHVQGIDAYVNLPQGDAGACAVCFESFDTSYEGPRQAFKLAACQHPASICTSCAMGLANKADAPKCHASGCGTKFTPNDVARLGHDPTALTRKLVNARPNVNTDWYSCPTSDCVGARPMATARMPAACQVCDTTSVYLGFDRQRDLTQVQRLIRGLFSDQRESDEVVLRECYHCGTATERNGGCPQMNCTHCNNAWDFYEGASDGGNYGRHGTQRYVPLGGMLTRIGLFGDLAPGSTAIDDLPERVAAQAQRLGIPVDLEADRSFLRRQRRGRLAITAH